MRPRSDISPYNELTVTQFRPNMFSYYSSGPHLGTGCFAYSDLLQSNLLQRPYNTQFNRPLVHRGSALQGGAGVVHMYNQVLTPLQIQLQIEILRREEMMWRILSGQNLESPRGVLNFEEQMMLNRGFPGEYRGKGTGVFIPRASPVPNRSGIAGPPTGTREQSARTRKSNQLRSHINSEEMFDTSKEAEGHYQLPPELALPQDWTY